MDERCRTCRLTDMQPETTVLFIKEKGPPMKKFGEFVVSTFVAGLLISSRVAAAQGHAIGSRFCETICYAAP